MRMWMLEPGLLCRYHLLGEHVETHMLSGHFRKGRSIKGYITSNCVEPLSLRARHDALVEEMLRRGYRHASPLDFSMDDLACYSIEDVNAVVDRRLSFKKLMHKCPKCWARYHMQEV